MGKQYDNAFDKSVYSSVSARRDTSTRVRGAREVGAVGVRIRGVSVTGVWDSHAPAWVTLASAARIV